MLQIFNGRIYIQRSALKSENNSEIRKTGGDKALYREFPCING